MQAQKQLIVRLTKLMNRDLIYVKIEVDQIETLDNHKEYVY